MATLIDNVWRHLVSGQLQHARGLLESANPRDPLAQCLSARLAIAEGQAGSAIETLRMLTRSNSDMVEIRVHLAAGLHAAGHRKAATEQAEQAVFLGARGADLELVLGSDALRIGDAREALESFDSALALCPTYVAVWLGKARALAHIGAVGDAESTYHRVLELSPQHAVAWRELIRLELRYGAEDAARDNHRAAQKTLDRPEVLDDLAPLFADDEPAPSDGFWEQLDDLLACAEVKPSSAIEQVFAQLSSRWHDDERFAVVRAASALFLSQRAQMTRSIHALTKLVNEPHHRRWQTLWLLGALQLSDTPLFHPHLAVGYLEEALTLTEQPEVVGRTLSEGYQRAGRPRLAAAVSERVRAL